MRSSTRQADGAAPTAGAASAERVAPVGLAARAVRAPRPELATQAVGALREEYYETRWGAGVLRLAGDLPLELEMPDPARRAEGAPRGRWSGLLERYFAGEPVAFDVDVAAYTEALGCTTFERDVFAALAAVPYGRPVSYRDLAHAAGRPNAYRAVGSVMARNTLPILLPCHRVIKNDGNLGSYGDDPTWKARLLRLEGWLPAGEEE
jgi:O-6-methylguanine DNA methyltransferase